MISGHFFRGTTPKHVFTLPFEKEEVSDLRITYSQEKTKILTKQLTDIEFDKNDIILKLTQEETLQFKANKEVSVQIKIKTSQGEVFNSDFIIMRVDETLDEGVM